MRWSFATFLPCTVLALVVAAAGASTGGAQPPRDAIVLLTSTDTFSVERFTRSAQRFESELVIRPAGARFTMVGTLDAQGRFLTLENAYRQASAERTSVPLQLARITFVGDSVTAVVHTSAGDVVKRFASRVDAIPFLNPSFGLIEFAIARARRDNRDTVLVPIFAVQGGQTLELKLVRLAGDSVLVDFGNAQARVAVNAAGEITGGEIPAQSLRLARIRGAGEGTTNVAAPDYSAPAGAPYTAQEVVVRTKEGHTLAGTLTMPINAKGPVPAFVTITGSGLQDRDEKIALVKGYRPFRQIADTLSRLGFAVLRMDDRGFGGSGGNAATSTSADFANDIRAGLTFLRARPDIDTTRLALIGHSEGGLIAPMVAAEDPSLRGIILMAGPSQSGRTIIKYQQTFAIEHNSAIAVAKRDSAMGASSRGLDSLAATNPWFRYFLDHDPLDVARRVKVPVLILQGANDRQVTADQAEELAKAIRAGGNRNVTVHIFPEANHLFVQDADGNPANYAKLPSGMVRDDVLRTLAEWAVRTVQGATPTGTKHT